MNVFVIGQKWLGAQVIGAVLRRGHTLAGVCCPRLAGDGSRRDLMHEAVPVGVAIHASYWPPKLPAEALPEGIDIILGAHATWRIGADVLGRSRLGGVAYHPSLLPRHRGPDAVRWTIAMREPIAGGSLYRLTDEMDAGPTVLQDWCHVLPGETAAELWRRELVPGAVRLFEMFLTAPEAYLGCAVAQDAAVATREPRFLPVEAKADTPVSSP